MYRPKKVTGIDTAAATNSTGIISNPRKAENGSRKIKRPIRAVFPVLKKRPKECDLQR
jgi:hypothetical protein